MKYICLFLIVVSTICCHEQKRREVILTPEQEFGEQAKIDLSGNVEKLTLLSSIKGISYDTLYHLLFDYIVKTSPLPASDDSNHIQTQNAIIYLSDKYRLSGKKISSIIFSYKYEMLTRDEIGQEAIDNAEPDEDPGDRPDY